MNANVVTFAMSGALTWEDLLNGQYRVCGPVRSFDDNEYDFWELLSGFASYLEESDEKPEINLQGKFQIKRDASNLCFGR